VKLVQAAILASLACAPNVSGAQSLTPSEQAAKTQRQMTGEERATWSKECKFQPVRDTRVDALSLNDMWSGPVVFLPPIRMLLFLSVRVDDPDQRTRKIVNWPDLPNGGLARFDFCSVMGVEELVPFTQHNQPVSYAGLRLRLNVDLETDYPSALPQMKKHGQILSTPPGRYIAITSDDPEAVLDWIRENYQTIPFREDRFPAITIDDAVYFPISRSAG